MDRLLPKQRDLYASDFATADATFDAGRVASHSAHRSNQWKNWCSYVYPLGVDPSLQFSGFAERVRLLSGYAARTRTGFYSRGRQVKAQTVSSALTAIGQTIALEHERNPIKVNGSSNLLPHLQQMLDGWSKADPPTQKQLPVKADVPEYIAALGQLPCASPLDNSLAT